MKAEGVANSPIVEVAAPAIHLGGRDPGRLIGKSRQHSSFVLTRGPQRGGEFVAAPELLREDLNVRYGNAESFAGGDAEADQIIEVPRSAFALEPGESKGDLFFQFHLAGHVWHRSGFPFIMRESRVARQKRLKSDRGFVSYEHHG